jgi:NAD(P)-dependent dehydrogenase (short-subunit alcohol dehydrogenase family)
MSQLNNKVAIVTGGAQGIGLAACEALGAAGAHVIIADIGKERMDAAAGKLVSLGCRCEFRELDVTEESSVRNLVEYAKDHRGGLDILVNSAGVPPYIGPFIRLSSAEWTRVLNVNLFGVFLCCREAGALMAAQQRGRIINIASLNATSPAALSVAYNVAKAGVLSLTQTLAVELAPFGVNVNAISPGPIETEFHDTVMPQRAATLGITRAEMVEKIRAAIPLGRWGRPLDIGRAVAFFASDQSEWITGQNLIVSGGLVGVSASPSKEVILGKPKPFEVE